MRTHSYAVRVVFNLSAYLEDHRNSAVYRVRAENATAAMLRARWVSGAPVAMEAERIELVQTPELEAC
jgi:hypothetical protein